MRVFLFVTFTAFFLCISSLESVSFVHNSIIINKTYSFILFFYFPFIGSIALDWPHSKGRVGGFHLEFANGTSHFRWLLTLYKDLPNWSEIFRLLSQPCFQRLF